MRELRFYEFLTGFQSYQDDNENEKLCDMEPRLRTRTGLEPRTAPSIGQGLTF